MLDRKVAILVLAAIAALAGCNSAPIVDKATADNAFEKGKRQYVDGDYKMRWRFSKQTITFWQKSQKEEKPESLSETEAGDNTESQQDQPSP